jgi:hypothetical protein
MWCPLRCCYVSRECTSPVDAAGAVRSRHLYGARSIGESEPVSLSARSSATHDLVIYLFHDLRDAPFAASGDRGCGCVQRHRPDRTRCRTDLAMRCGRQGSALGHLDYRLLAALAQPLRRSAVRPVTTAGLLSIPAGSTDQPLFYDLVEGAHSSNDASNELDDPLHRDAMLCVER